MMPRMFSEGEIERGESERAAAHRLMKTLDDAAAMVGMVVAGEVEISASESSVFGAPRVMRLEADVVTR